MKIAPDGFPVVAFSGFMFIGSLFFVPVISPAFVILTFSLAWFFRDPERAIPGGEDTWVSPADGKVIELVKGDHPFMGSGCYKIGIFMSVLDVHVNRTPFTGVVEHLEYVPGEKMMAFNEKASEKNERMYVGLMTDKGPLLMVQIAGFLARRIVCRLSKGDLLEKGQRFGMIKLGSRVDVYLPPGVEPRVHVGHRVRAGASIIGVNINET
ncbi:MAG: phosphatidylserine decarboxylase family protein [Synergistales bacterium]|nr:phosphatidylserine decarboxylase family protein [Synergistales bacterium]